MRPFIHLFLVLAALLGLSACGPRPAGDSSGKPSIVATTTMIADMVREIGGQDIELAALMGPGVDPHLYKPSAEDARKLGTAKAIFYNGLMLEGRMGEMLDRLAAQGRAVHAVTSKMPATSLLQNDDGSSHSDPHVWGDARLWTSAIEVVVEGLSAVIPDQKAAFSERGAQLKASYLALHEWALAETAKIPAERRVIITSHDAFNYFGRAYGFQVVGVQGISTVSEAGLADVAKTVDFIKEKGVKAIFVESSVPHATIERIAKDSGAKIGGELFSDALGTPGERVQIDGHSYDCGTYGGMLRSNVSRVVNALK
jgi:manganese/zinc/iron transport system substrate-binding protein